MIEIYKAFNENFENNGDMTLIPETCSVGAKLNGTWELGIEHLIDNEERWKYILEGAVIAAPFLSSKKQLFRIYWKQKTGSRISAKARPVFMDSADEIFLKDVRPTDKNGQDALQIMMAGQTKYTASSNITKHTTAYYFGKNLIEAIQGSGNESFVNQWGGEIYYDNYHVTINEHIGSGASKRIENGLVREGIESEVNMENMATRLIPIAYNGYGISEDMFWVDSPLIGNYPKIYTKVVEFPEVKMADDARESDTEEIIVCNTQAELDAALKTKCQELYQTGVDRPEHYYKVPLFDLSKTEEYKDLKGLEKLGLGDEIVYTDMEYNVEIKERIIGVVYDCIGERNESVEIGKFTYNYVDELESVIQKVEQAINENGTVKGENIQGIINGVKTMMRAQATAAQPAEVRATIFEDLNPVSPTYGALCLGTMGFQIAYTRTAEGSEWDWRTFGTGKGFFADCITAGTMLCDRIRGGTLKLGGLDNVDGLLQMLNASGVEIGRWDKDGITISKGTIRSADYVKGKSGMEINLDSATMTSYRTEVIDGTEHKTMCVLSNGMLSFSNVDDEKEYLQIRFNKTDSDGYIPEIAMAANGKSFCITPTSLYFLIGTMMQASMGIDGNGYGYVNTKRLWLDGPIETGGHEGQTMRIELPGDGYMQFINGVFVKGEAGTYGLSGTAEFSDGSYMHFTDGMLDGGSTTEGGTIG